MSDRPWWMTVIQWPLWAVVMTIVMGWLGRSRFRRHATEAGTLRHPRSTLIMGLVCFGLFAALTVASAFTLNMTATWWTTAGFAAFAALSAPMVLDYFMAHHRVSTEGLAYRKMLGKRGFLKWSDLTKVRYVSTLKWFRLEAASGEVVRISAMLMGLPEFAHALLQATPASAIDADTLRVLEETADGSPPSPWA